LKILKNINNSALTRNAKKSFFSDEVKFFYDKKARWNFKSL